LAPSALLALEAALVADPPHALSSMQPGNRMAAPRAAPRDNVILVMLLGRTR
jgi:hypothetical protein